MGDLNSKLKEQKDQKRLYRYRNKFLKAQGIRSKTKNSQNYLSIFTFSLLFFS